MIARKPNISNETPFFLEYKDKVYIPDVIVELTSDDNGHLEEKNVTCIFLTIVPGFDSYKIIGVEYFDLVTNEILLSKRYIGIDPSFVTIYNGKPFNIYELKEVFLTR